MEARFLSGQFLLAMPGIGDPRFERSVIVICAHDDSGAMGICLHQALDEFSTADLMRQLDIEPADTISDPVLMGGPVEPERGFVLHTADWGGEDTRHVANRFALTTTRDVLAAIAAGKGPRQHLCALGYAGWGPGQLDDELARHGWFSTPGSEALIWQTPPAQRWEKAFRLSGIEPAMLSASAGRA